MSTVFPFLLMGVFLFCLGIYFYRGDVETVRRKELLRRLSPRTRSEAAAHVERRLRKREIRAERLIAAFMDIARIEELIVKSGVRLSVEKLFLILTLSALAGLLAGLVVFGEFPPALLLTIGGAFLPIAVLRHRQRQRESRFSEQFPEAIDFIVRALKAGQSVDHAFGGVSAHFPSPVGDEFRIMYEEVALGLSFADAVDHFSRRFPEMADVRFFRAALVIQRETGGNLTRILDNLSRTIRARFRFEGQIRTLTAEGRLSGMMLALLPIGYAGLNYLLNPDYMSSFFTDPSLRRLLFLALGMDALGLVVMRMMAKVDI